MARESGAVTASTGVVTSMRTYEAGQQPLLLLACVASTCLSGAPRMLEIHVVLNCMSNKSVSWQSTRSCSALLVCAPPFRPMLIKVEAELIGLLLSLTCFRAPRSSALIDRPKASLIGRVSAANARHT